MNNIKTTKKAYKAPRLTVHGNATELTQRTSSGNRFDRVIFSPADNGAILFTAS